MFNARSETVHEKWSFRGAFRSRRALIPATAFFEKGHFFSLPENPIFAFAGLWDCWEGDGQVVESCTILTTEPNELVGKVHHRMPVILNEEDYDFWLSPDISERQPLEHLFRPYDPEQMKMYSAG